MKSKLFSVLILVFMLFLAANSNTEPRKVLLEYCTGTWCGWCPCGHQTIANQILPAYPNTVIISYHGAGSDPWQNFEGSSVRSMLGFNAYPTAIVDRGNTPSNPYYTYDMWMGGVSNRYNNSPNTQINLQVISKTYNTSTRELTATINATALQNLTGNYRIQFVILENNLIYQQNHYAQCGYSGYIQNYVHKHVARSMVNGATGELLNSGGVWNTNQTLSKSMTKTIDNAWVADNCHLVAFVYQENPVLALSTVHQANEISVTGPLGIEKGNEIPAIYSLSQNYPNPFNPATKINFSLPKSGDISMNVYDISGKLVETIAEGFFEAGTYNAEIDASEWSSGIYFYTLKAGNFVETKKMMLVK